MIIVYQALGEFDVERHDGVDAAPTSFCCAWCGSLVPAGDPLYLHLGEPDALYCSLGCCGLAHLRPVRGLVDVVFGIYR